MLELQITKEYLGFATHLVYLAPLFEEVLRADTTRQGGLDGRHVIDGSVDPYALHGHGGRHQHRHRPQLVRRRLRLRQLVRLRAPRLGPAPRSAAIADEWLRMTFTNDAGLRRAGEGA